MRRWFDIGLFTMIALIVLFGSLAEMFCAWQRESGKASVMSACLAHHTVAECKELK